MRVSGCCLHFFVPQGDPTRNRKPDHPAIFLKDNPVTLYDVNGTNWSNSEFSFIYDHHQQEEGQVEDGIKEELARTGPIEPTRETMSTVEEA